MKAKILQRISNGVNKKLIISLSVIGVVAAIAIGGTIAYFSDVETSTGNIFKAGKLNLKIDNECYYNGQLVNECTWELKDLDDELFFNFLDVKPGDSGEDTISLHVDNNPAWICAEVANLVKDDNGCEKPESDIDTTCGAGQGELQDNLFFSVFKDYNCDNIKNGDDYYVVQDQPAQAGFWPIADSQHGPAIPGGATICYGVKWNVPLSTSNIIQSDSLLGNVIFTAVQSRHMDNFICSPSGPCVPQTEVCDGQDNDCDGQIDEGNVCAVCGDGLIGGNEGCDDDNTISDDGCSASCYVEPGFQCTGQPSVCTPVCTPSTEVCDGLDNDCNPATADGSSDPLLGASCDGPDSDLCNEGTRSCSAGALVCSDSTGSTIDLCNGFNDDCDPASSDGSEDPLNGTACDGPDSDLCLEGTRSCTAGALTCSDATGSTTEICGDGLDNDCDGQIDELGCM